MFQLYFKSIQEKFLSDKESSEHTYRTFLENLLNNFERDISKRNLIIKHEPARQADKGRPDFKVTTREQLTIGLIETKKIGEDLKKIINSKQLIKYKELSDNIILTDYLHFYLIKKGVPVLDVALFSDYNLQNKKFKVEINRIEDLTKLLKLFFESEPETIYKTQDLALKLSEKARFLKDYSYEELKNSDDDTNLLKGLFNAFQNTLLPLLEYKYFADIYAQTLTYGLFISALNCEDPKIQLNRDTAYKLLPNSFPLIRELFHSLDDFPTEIIWIIDEIISILKVTDFKAIKVEFAEYRNKEIGFNDPFIYFYEDFLRHYDKTQKDIRGVFYTPEPVVSFIVRSIEEILKDKFGIIDGFINKNVTTLDFATGTGTFLLYLFKNAIEQGLKIADKETVNKILNEQIIANVYGFELLVAPYVIAHLKISEYLKEMGFSIESGKRLKIFLTNTLTNNEPQSFPIMPNLSKEGKEANKIKNKDILVILGNPPYSIHSENTDNWLMNLLEIYKPTDEKKLNLDDDYIKFIRFAHWKMDNINQGVIGIITNNSFLNGLIHRKMRGELLNNFDEIYVLNLHGNSRIGEKCPDGTKDENVFDIMQGVCISLFIKVSNNSNKKCKLYYKDLWGKRELKYCTLFENTLKSIDYEEIDYYAFNDGFTKTKWGKNRFNDDLSFFVPKKLNGNLDKYGNSIGLNEIFNLFGSGVSTLRDRITIHIRKDKLKAVIDDFIKLSEYELKLKYSLSDSRDWKIASAKMDVINTNALLPYYKILYRPFDIRYIFYSGQNRGFIGTPQKRLANNFLNIKNIGIIFPRITVNKFEHCFVSELMVDYSAGGAHTAAETYIAPLYIYSESETNGNGNDVLFKDNSKRDNFTKEFRQFIKFKYKNQYSPEQILGYLYAILHSPSYRSKYLEFLKIDYPRIPFTENESLFNELSSIGFELIEHHLLKRSYPDGLCRINGSGTNYNIEKVEYEKGKIWFNNSRYFESISDQIWNFNIGGYQVLDKWLKERKKNQISLSSEDIQHFIKVVNILNYTIYSMQEIDDLTKDWL